MKLPHVGAAQGLFEPYWNYAQDATIAIEAGTGIVIDVNSAAEALTGYAREELIGKHEVLLHPETEREKVHAEFQRPEIQVLPHTGFHLQSKDGRCTPLSIWSSQPLQLAGRSVTISEFRDITKLQEQEHRLATKRWALSAYAGAASAIWEKHSSKNFLEAICEAITRESVYALAWVATTEDRPENLDNRIDVAAAAGSKLSYLEGLHLTWNEDDPRGGGPLGICIRTGAPQIMQDTETFPAFEPWRERAKKAGIRSGVIIPLPMKGIRRGALVVYADRPNAFEPVAIEVFQHLAEQIGHGIHAIEQEQLLVAEREHVARTELQLTKALSAMVAPMVLAMEMRDPYTAGHQSRVADIAVGIGREMGLPEEQLHGLRVAAQVHDIGKISIPAEILTKPGELNAAERAMINGHAEIGYTILKDIPFPWPIAEIVRQHHEKLDGSGYPRGLKADAILPEAKILAVADIVEAMASYRPYRQGIDIDRVLKHIEEGAGSLLDPEVVRICVSLFRDKHLCCTGLDSTLTPIQCLSSDLLTKQNCPNCSRVWRNIVNIDRRGSLQTCKIKKTVRREHLPSPSLFKRLPAIDSSD